MLVDKETSISVVLSLEDFLEKRFPCRVVCPDLLNRDLGMAHRYYALFSEMKKTAEDFGNSWKFFSVPGSMEDCIIVDSKGVASRREVNFEEIKKFSDYIVREYGV